MLFATTSFSPVRAPRTIFRPPPPRGMRGLGDAVSDSDPCTTNPSDPVCVQFYGGLTPAQKAAVNPDPTSGEIVFGVNPNDCRAGTTWDPAQQICAPNPNQNPTDAIGQMWASLTSWMEGGVSAAGPQVKVGSVAPTSTAASLKSLATLKTALALLAVGAAGFGGYKLYEKYKRK